MPTLPDPVPQAEEGPPLNFDDLLDIAREFEFTHTISHIWPCEEEPSAYHDMGLEDILAVIVPTPNTEQSPLPLPTPDPVQVQEADLHRSASSYPASSPDASISRGAMPLSRNDDQTSAMSVEPPITSILRGWSPPDGSQFLDLDDSLVHPQSLTDVWTPPWLAAYLAPPCTQPATSASQSPPITPATGDVHPQTELKVPLVSTGNKTPDNARKKTVPVVPLPVQPSACAIPEPARARSSMRTNPNAQRQAAIIPRAKTQESRVQPSSAPATSDAPSARYARAPRGGIPPHIARTVTKANILRIEKERKVMQDAFSSTTAVEGKKPSVLRRAGKVADGNGGGKKYSIRSENGDKEGRAAKRVRV